MSGNSRGKNEKKGAKSVSTMVQEAIERNGFKDVKECARSIKVPYDLFNKVVGGHIPKDTQLLDYAKKLKIDRRELIIAAYREKAPDEMKKYFNSVNLLEDHNNEVREILQLVDECDGDQLNEMLHIARLVRSSSRDYCRKALSLLELYQQMDQDVMNHFDSLVLLSMKNNKLSGLKNFKNAIENQKGNSSGRRGRLRA